ncbi:MAG: hypothetical protein WBA20_19320 [Ketobacter sp.]|nr:MAG: hypothetical protein D6160_15710 [Ketobacter sp.]
MYFNDDISQKGSFDLVSDYYDRARPNYPLEVYSVVKFLLELSDLGSNDSANILEVGSGSGQATENLVDLGGRIDCIERGKNFCEILDKTSFQSNRFFRA